MKTAAIVFCVMIIIITFAVVVGQNSSLDSMPSGREKTRMELVVYCGAGIRTAAAALINEFEKEFPVTIKATYGGSGQLLGQISTLQHGDIFMPGAEFYVDRAIENGLADKRSKRIVAYFIPVIFVEKGNPKHVGKLDDLFKGGLRIGVGDERSCAVGKKFMEILAKNGIEYGKISDAIVYKSATVNELGMAVQLKNCDAVVIWDANARHFSRYGDIIKIPAERNCISSIPVVRLKSSIYPEAAEQFIQFITSDKGKAILRKKGYACEPQTCR